MIGAIGYNGPMPDYPAESDVTAGVTYAYDTLTGTALGGGSEADYPAETDVRAGVEFGDGLVGTLIVGYTPPESSNIFDQVFSTTATAFNAAFGEAVTYHPHEGIDRDITAIVTHKDNRGLGNHNRSPEIEVTVLDSNSVGISNEELEESLDSITITMPDGTISKRAIVKRLRVANGEIKLLMR